MTRTKPKWPPERVFVVLRETSGSAESFVSHMDAMEWSRFLRGHSWKTAVHEYRIARLVPRKSLKGKPVRLSAKSRNENKPAKRRGKRG
jgi:hypothetical protein